MRALGLWEWFDGDFSRDYICDYDALTDLPIGLFYQQIDKSYPGSKFILTVRNRDEWLDSCFRFFSGKA